MDDFMRYPEIEDILISSSEIEDRVDEMGRQITEDYKDKDEPIVLVGILKGSVMFLTDLARKIELPVSFDFMSVSSYGIGTTSTGDVRILKDLDQNIEGKHIIIVEDIVDTGFTLHYIIKSLEARGAKSIKICSLLNKPDRRVEEIPISYLGFDIPDEFVVGYGIDFAEKFRNLPFIGIIKRNIYE